MPRESPPSAPVGEDRTSAPLSATAAGLTERLTHLATQWQDPHPVETSQAGERAFVDTLACAIAAQEEPAVRIAGGAFASGASHSRVLGLPYAAGTDPQTIAILGGLAAHALDFDDVDDATISHPSAVLVPALLALSAARDLSGQTVVDAYTRGTVAGRIIAADIGIERHYELGWHSTSTIGTVAAAVATSCLLGLDAAATRHALGVAGSLAAGSRQNFGTMTKPLHAGIAASNAVLAALLAEGGFTADASQLESPLGFLALHSPGTVSNGTAATVTTADSVAEPIGLNIKAYPCCYYIQAAADAVSDLTESGLRAEDIATIEVCVQPGGLVPLIHHRPITGLEGKFSMEYAIAAMLLDHELTPQSFTDAAVNRGAAQELIPRVVPTTSQLPPIGAAEWTDGYAVVTATSKDGHTRTHRVDRPRGHVTRPLDEDRLRAKFDGCLAFAGLAADDETYSALRRLSSRSSMADFAQMLVASVTPAEVALP
ncbi:MmgE/PrpD family protein [Brevibacterium marinum]|uniref:2-methylcitrate dehydratase PrpD n=1 Tax=Brevibacterium marinum TaxID=418643 RepID=A0A846RY06_9MICO|nr:MmgE/PrpD family protein [Brevibacterium marinum]NJC56010.1 2-methylcitrate dehydratase PrpD [Brevibacterium marinum]